MLQRQFSSCDMPGFAKKFCCGDIIMTYGVANGAFLLDLAILQRGQFARAVHTMRHWGHFVPAS